MQRGQAMTNELKPCPFCEGTGRLESEDQCGGFGCYTTIVCVKCQNCGATGARSDEYFHGRYVRYWMPLPEPPKEGDKNDA